MSRRRRGIELPMPALGHVVFLHTSKIKPYMARGHYVCSCKDLCETQLSRCEIQICLCAAIVVLELADLHSTAKVFHIQYKYKDVREYNMSLLVQRSFAAFGGSCAPDMIYEHILVS